MADRIDDRPRTIGELAAIYGVSRPTLRFWIKHLGIRKLPNSNYYSINDVRRIVKELGSPDDTFIR